MRAKTDISSQRQQSRHFFLPMGCFSDNHFIDVEIPANVDDQLAELSGLYQLGLPLTAALQGRCSPQEHNSAVLFVAGASECGDIGKALALGRHDKPKMVQQFDPYNIESLIDEQVLQTLWTMLRYWFCSQFCMAGNEARLTSWSSSVA
jgi:hypothetical protein